VPQIGTDEEKRLSSVFICAPSVAKTISKRRNRDLNSRGGIGDKPVSPPLSPQVIFAGVVASPNKSKDELALGLKPI
jgi:hypothetical protein